MSNVIKLKKAVVEDIPVISELADKVWKAHYPSIITMEQINYMLDLMYSDKSLREQITTKQNDFYLIESEGKNIGFLSVSKIGQDSYMLHKFYILQDLAKKGSGSKAFHLLVQTIKPKKITLTVNRKNFKSINFYFKNGFIIDHVEDFDIGNGFVMEDFVMIWKAIR